MKKRLSGKMVKQDLPVIDLDGEEFVYEDSQGHVIRKPADAA